MQRVLVLFLLFALPMSPWAVSFGRIADEVACAASSTSEDDEDLGSSPRSSGFMAEEDMVHGLPPSLLKACELPLDDGCFEAHRTPREAPVREVHVPPPNSLV